MTTLRVPSRRTLTLASSALLVVSIAGCATSTQQAAGPKDAVIVVSQDGKSDPGNNPKVNVPFYITGANFDASTTVKLRFYAGTDTKGKRLFDMDTQSTDKGTISALVNNGIPTGQYAVEAQAKGEKAEEQFQVATPRTPGMVKVTSDGSAPKAMLSPVIRNGKVYVSQSVNQGSIFEWAQADLPTTVAKESVTVKPTASWQPKMPDGVKIEQINFNNGGDQLLMGKKSVNANTTGGNSIFSYPYGGGEGKHLAGNIAPAGNGYYTWGPGAGPDTTPHNTAEGAFKYTSKAFPTKTPTQVSIGDGAGVVQDSNGWYYFSSLQSGCVYKMSPDSTWADYVYCIPSWGANNQNQSVYSLAEDAQGNVYAVYQGASNDNTIVLKIKPSGSQADDNVQAIQIDGWARSVGLAVNSDGTEIFVDGTSMKQYNTNNTNSILSVSDPKWGDVAKPTPTTPTSVSTIPGEPWLTGLAYDEATDIVYAADNNGGFYMNFR